MVLDKYQNRKSESASGGIDTSMSLPFYHIGSSISRLHDYFCGKIERKTGLVASGRSL